jgi:hypothetical protein
LNFHKRFSQSPASADKGPHRDIASLTHYIKPRAEARSD